MFQAPLFSALLEALRDCKNFKVRIDYIYLPVNHREIFTTVCLENLQLIFIFFSS